MDNINEKLPKATDLSHHISNLSKARQTSPLKGLARYWGKPGLISLAGGMPAPAYFPLSTLSAETLVQDSFAPNPPDRSSSTSTLSWFWRFLGAEGPSKKERTEHLSVPKYAATPGDVSLEVALQYGTATGLVPLQLFLKEFTTKVYQPGYSNFTTLVHAGNTDGFFKSMCTFLNPGELFITEEWTYPSALATAQPFGVLPVPVAMDSDGMRSDALRKLLEEWNEEERGAKRPHVMYTVPVGQNPTGATMGATRKKEIYDICVTYDILIIEDDPYYFLQVGKYFPKTERSQAYSRAAKEAHTDESAAFVASLVPSYLRFDYQGRVIRLDSFSKTVAPGSRLGWFTCNEVFAERLERQGEVSTQAPCGFGQSIITQLLTKQWGYNGYVRWLRGLRSEYTIRRDFFVDALAEEFRLTPTFITSGPGAWCGTTAYVARPKYAHLRGREIRRCLQEKNASDPETILLSFVPPTSGMFVWIKVHFENHPAYDPSSSNARSPPDEDSLEYKLFVALAEANLLVGPGTFFAATDGVQEGSREGHLRIAFSNADFDTLKKGAEILRRVVLDFFGL